VYLVYSVYSCRYPGLSTWRHVGASSDHNDLHGITLRLRLIFLRCHQVSVSFRPIRARLYNECIGLPGSTEFGISMTCTEHPVAATPHAIFSQARLSYASSAVCVAVIVLVLVLVTGVVLTGYTDSPHRPPAQRIHVYCSCSSIF